MVQCKPLRIIHWPNHKVTQHLLWSRGISVVLLWVRAQGQARPKKIRQELAESWPRQVNRSNVRFAFILRRLSSISQTAVIIQKKSLQWLKFLRILAMVPNGFRDLTYSARAKLAARTYIRFVLHQETYWTGTRKVSGFTFFFASWNSTFVVKQASSSSGYLIRSYTLRSHPL
jgi:hypothetical protein